MTGNSPQPSADAVWAEVSALFSNVRGMRPRKSWFTGLSVGAGRHRLERLTASKAARTIMPRIEALSDSGFALFQTYVRVNFEQAQAAMRLTLIANITIPVGFLVIANQFFPGLVQDFIDFTSLDATLIALGTAGAALCLAIWYCYAGVFQARDLSHLTAIAAAKRGADPQTGVNGDDMDTDDPTEPVGHLL